jgi:hypothetical protein
MPYTTLLLIICCAVFYYRVGEAEYSSGGLLALASVALWGIGILVFKFGWLGNLLIQVGLFLALSFWNMRRKPPE